jgi:hypothetical protein
MKTDNILITLAGFVLGCLVAIFAFIYLDRPKTWYKAEFTVNKVEYHPASSHTDLVPVGETLISETHNEPEYWTVCGTFVANSVKYNTCVNLDEKATIGEKYVSYYGIGNISKKVYFRVE